MHDGEATASTPVAKFASRNIRIVNVDTSGYHALCADSEGRVFAAGANAFVAGSAIFKGDGENGYRANIEAIRAAARG